MAFHGSQEDGGIGGGVGGDYSQMSTHHSSQIFTHHNTETTPTPTPFPKSHVFLMCHNRLNTKQGWAGKAEGNEGDISRRHEEVDERRTANTLETGGMK